MIEEEEQRTIVHIKPWRSLLRILYTESYLHYIFTAQNACKDKYKKDGTLMDFRRRVEYISITSKFSKKPLVRKQTIKIMPRSCTRKFRFLPPLLLIAKLKSSPTGSTSAILQPRFPPQHPLIITILMQIISTTANLPQCFTPQLPTILRHRWEVTSLTERKEKKENPEPV